MGGAVFLNCDFYVCHEEEMCIRDRDLEERLR